MSEFFDTENGFGDARDAADERHGKPPSRRAQAFARSALQEADIWDAMADKYARQMKFAQAKAAVAREDARKLVGNYPFTTSQQETANGGVPLSGHEHHSPDLRSQGRQ